LIIRLLVLAFAILLVVAGVLWTGQGLGWWGDDGSDQDSLATIGPLVAGLGVALGIVSLRPRP
jgi:hypothetical protein